MSTGSEGHHTEISLINRRGFLAEMSNAFSEQELRELCYLLPLDDDDLEAQGKTHKVRCLVQYFINRKRLSVLVEVLKEKRPNIPWETYFEKNNKMQTTPNTQKGTQSLGKKHTLQKVSLKVIGVALKSISVTIKGITVKNGGRNNTTTINNGLPFVAVVVIFLIVVVAVKPLNFFVSNTNVNSHPTEIAGPTKASSLIVTPTSIQSTPPIADENSTPAPSPTLLPSITPLPPVPCYQKSTHQSHWLLRLSLQLIRPGRQSAYPPQSPHQFHQFI